ncbi:hypothetical protein COLO4_12796 [Corchorus olitorius]|uniref:Uncharacterized protein n=1 Tax=Corchorus olitorius TaxID=93759 RepID=A0A1R3JZN1_9ROSI|nr:hypothetical protein COLO4_12796 [Corchorus olitorius]
MSEREPRDGVCVRSEGLREDERESNFFQCRVWMCSVRRVENLRKGGCVRGKEDENESQWSGSPCSWAGSISNCERGWGEGLKDVQKK